MRWEINVLLAGRHLFTTNERNDQDKSHMMKVWSILENKFPKDEGYVLTITEWNYVGTRLDWRS